MSRPGAAKSLVLSLETVLCIGSSNSEIGKPAELSGRAKSTAHSESTRDVPPGLPGFLEKMNWSVE